MKRVWGRIESQSLYLYNMFTFCITFYHTLSLCTLVSPKEDAQIGLLARTKSNETGGTFSFAPFITPSPTPTMATRTKRRNSVLALVSASVQSQQQRQQPKALIEVRLYFGGIFGRFGVWVRALACAVVMVRRYKRGIFAFQRVRILLYYNMWRNTPTASWSARMRKRTCARARTYALLNPRLKCSSLTIKVVRLVYTYLEWMCVHVCYVDARPTTTQLYI